MKSLFELEFCVIDTETTGGSACYNRVIDVAVFRFKEGEIVEKFQTLVNPGRPIPPWITLLTGIDDEMVAQAPPFSEVAAPLRAILEKGIFTGHNAPFDYEFIRHEFMRLGEEFIQPHFCTLKLARRLYPELPSKKLGALCEHLLIDIWDRHRASGDAEATVTVLKNILKELEGKHAVKTWEDLEIFLTKKRKKVTTPTLSTDLYPKRFASPTRK